MTDKNNYVRLDVLTTQKYIKFIKDTFERKLAENLNLTRVSAPLFVTRKSGLQDDLSGKERAVSFDVAKDGQTLEIVQSLAKWKRMALKKYGFACGDGLYTDMTAIRRDDKMDELHSVYVDQWDWEKIIDPSNRNLDYLKQTVNQIVRAVKQTEKALAEYGFVSSSICEDVYFVTSQQLLDAFPDKTAAEREYAITQQYKTVFVMQIGDKLSDGQPHDLRAPDYDDWSLNGDLLFYHETLDCVLELSSMGIRVNDDRLREQLRKTSDLNRLDYAYHKAVVNNALPQTIGGGIGQSRLCMLLLKRAHIGEVQASYWDEQTLEQCKKLNIPLL